MDKISLIDRINDIELKILKKDIILNDSDLVQFHWIRGKIEDVSQYDLNEIKRLCFRLDFILKTEVLILPDKSTLKYNNIEGKDLLEFKLPSKLCMLGKKRKNPYKIKLTDALLEIESLKVELKSKDIEIDDINNIRSKMGKQLYYSACEMMKMNKNCEITLDNYDVTIIQDGFKFKTKFIESETKYGDDCYICLSEKGQAEFDGCNHSICLKCLFDYGKLGKSCCGICNKGRDIKREKIINKMLILSDEQEIFNLDDII